MNPQTDLELFIPHARQGEYFTLPFEVPEATAEMTLTYSYQRHTTSQAPAGLGEFERSEKINTIDLGLLSPDGRQVGASGSDKLSVTISETTATPGYRPCPLTPGTWQILVGAYKVAPEGVTVHYTLSFKPKALRLLMGDLHTHTVGSDGVLTASELATHALRHGLDFLAITDHNQLVSRDALPIIEGITLIPGVEWTHYQGHANFLGVGAPYDEPFFTNSLAETQARFASAHARGALITINHPFEEGCPFQFDLHSLHFDALEVWNGPMRESNLRAIGLWQSLLAAGQRIPITGGSDYHRDKLFQILGGPSMGVYALSAGQSDILAAVKAGHSFITFAPKGPRLQLRCGDAIMGDEISFQDGLVLDIQATGLQAGDTLRLVSKDENLTLLQATGEGNFDAHFNAHLSVSQPGFYRVEILRVFLPGVPPLPALISNPLYFK